MNITETLYVRDRKGWRAWLRANYRSKKEIWLIYYKKASGKPRIAYNDAVEEALCFGWIDSIIKKMDDERFTQRFSPRKPKSGYSQANKERLRKLIRRGQVVKGVRDKLGDVLEGEAFQMPPDILSGIMANEEAWKHFQEFSDGYKRIRISYIDSSRSRPAEFRKRLENFIRLTAGNKKFGYVNVEDIISESKKTR
jgi:uncharacterized protein YdeI (YjbR/CyaY-like superfamily)